MYDSIADFYASPVRWRSDERDYGLRWRGADGTTYRAAWVRDTGELYSVRHITAADASGAVEVLARVGHRELEQALAGWQDECGAPRSYEWLRERVAGVSAARSRAALRGRSEPLRSLPRSPAARAGGAARREPWQPPWHTRPAMRT